MRDLLEKLEAKKSAQVGGVSPTELRARATKAFSDISQALTAMRKGADELDEPSKQDLLRLTDSVARAGREVMAVLDGWESCKRQMEDEIDGMRAQLSAEVDAHITTKRSMLPTTGE